MKILGRIKYTSLIVIIAVSLIGCSSNVANSIYDNDEKIKSSSNTYNLNKEEQIISGGEYTANIELEGMDTIWSYNSEDDSKIEIDYKLSVKNGIAKMVLIKPNGDLETIVESKDNKEQVDKVELDLKAGENRIKIVARDKAQIDMMILIDKGKFKEVGL